MRALVIILGVIALSCSPKLSTPQVHLADRYTLSTPWLSSDDIDSMWWQTIEDRELASLVERALSRNLSLQATQLAVSQAQYNLRVARSGYLPDLSFELSAERLREVEVYESEYEVVPTVSWQIPLFGAYKSTTQIAKSQIMSAEWQARGAALTLSSEVAKAYYSILEYRSSLEVAQRSSELRGEATALVDSMHYHGMSSGVELSQAKALLASAQEDVAKYSLALSLSERSLALLLSCSRDSLDFGSITSTIYSVSTPESVPVGVPSDLLYNRPDLRQAYFDIQEAMGEVGLARSAQFPSLSLTVDGGAYSTSLKGLTLSKLLTWEWAADLVAPIFNFRALRSKKLSKMDSYKSTLLTYQQTILSSLNDVDSAITSIEYTTQEQQSSRAYMENYQSISRATNALYRGGMDSYLSVVEAEREFYAAQIDYISLLSAQCVNYINLYTALGGGFND